MSQLVQILALLCVVFGMLLLLAAYRLNSMVRPTGHVDLVDTQQEAYIPHGPLIDTKNRLAGQPHGLLRLLAQGQTVPVVVVDAPAPGSLPDPAHRFQMALFCYLTEQVYDQPVPYGLIRYADADLSVNWTPGLSDELFQLIDRMRADQAGADVPRSHDAPARCRTCIVRSVCNQALE
jgi:CRISPR/Cas system-associated exonuclease Cas4 (RecB family)